VLAHGQVIAEGPPALIEQDPRVLSEYLGVTEASGQLTIAGEVAAITAERGEDR
jgi:branched-chain amino acid transport system permease protein